MTITVAANNARIRYTATSSQTAFAIPFEFFENDEIYVYVAATALVSAAERGQGTGSTEYGISGGGGSTGAIAFVTGITQGHIVTIVRDIPIERITDFTAGTTINRAALNTQLDTLTAMVGDLKDKSDRAIRLHPYDSEITLFLPTIDNRAGKIFGFDANGNLTTDTAANFDITLDDIVMNTLTMSSNANSKVNLIAATDSQIVANGAVLNLKSTKSSNTSTITLDGSTTYGIDFNAGNKAIRMQDATLFSSTAEVTGALTAPLIVSQSGGTITLQPTGNQVFIKGTGGESRITFHNPAAPSMEFTGDSSLIGSGSFLLDITDEIILDSASGSLLLKDAGTLRMTFGFNGTAQSITSANELTIASSANGINIKPATSSTDFLATNGAQTIGVISSVGTAHLKWYQNSNTTLLKVVDPTGTRTLLLPDESGTIHSSGGATTHANITVSTDGKVQFRDSAIYIQSGADGHLDLVADTEIHIAATTVNVDGLMDVSGNLSVGGNFDVTGSIDFSDANITNVGSIALDRITNDGGGGITLDSSSGIILDSSQGQFLFKDDTSTRLTIAINNSANQTLTSLAALSLISGADINLRPNGGQLYILNNSGGDNFQFNTGSSPTLAIHQNSNRTNLGLVSPTATRNILFPDASDTLVGKATTDTLTNKTLTSPDINGGTIDGAVIGGSSAAAITGTAITGTSFASTGNMTFADSDKAIFGAGSDLQIYHDGLNSYIDDQGTGRLYIRASDQLRLQASDSENYALFAAGGAVKLYYDNAEKFDTTNTGVNITGTLTADGLTMDTAANTAYTMELGANRTSAGQALGIIRGSWDDTVVAQINIAAGDDTTNKDNGRIFLRTASAGSTVNRVQVAENGDISFYEDTGSTAKLFWDASAESLGIGDTTPESTITVKKDVTDASIVKAYSSASNSRVSYQIGNDADNWFMGIDGGNSDAFFIADVVSSSDRLIITQAGSVGIGVVPEAWGSNADAMQIGNSGMLFGQNNANVFTTGSNFYWDNTNYKRINADLPSRHVQFQGEHIFGHAVSGSADTNISWLESMRIDSAGRVNIGTSTAATGFAAINIKGGPSGSPEHSGIQATYGGGTFGGFAITTVAQGGGADFYNFTGDVGSETYSLSMRIDSSGNVLLGTTTEGHADADNLTISGNNRVGMTIRSANSGSSRIYFSDGTSGAAEYVGAITYDHSDNHMRFLSGADETFRIDASQNLLVGKTSASDTSAGFQIVGGNVATITNGSGSVIQVNDGSAFKWRVNANGGVYNYQSNNVNLSDQREKKNIEALGTQWDAVKAWSVKEFHYNEDENSDAKKVGVIAQDVETNHPNLVTDFELSEEKTRKAVKEQQLMWLAIKALQEAQARIETLETKVAALEG